MRFIFCRVYVSLQKTGNQESTLRWNAIMTLIHSIVTNTETLKQKKSTSWVPEGPAKQVSANLKTFNTCKEIKGEFSGADTIELQ